MTYTNLSRCRELLRIHPQTHSRFLECFPFLASVVGSSDILAMERTSSIGMEAPVNVISACDPCPSSIPSANLVNVTELDKFEQLRAQRQHFLVPSQIRESRPSFFEESCVVSSRESAFDPRGCICYSTVPRMTSRCENYLF